MEAKFDGICRVCYEPIYMGEKIVYDNFEQTWVHPECKTEEY